MHTKWTRPALAVISTAILINAQSCFATVEKDIELLRLVAMAHQANRAGIDTWQGHVLIESTLADSNGPIVRDRFSVDFLSDCRREVTRWTWIHDERYVREGLEINGKPISRTVLEPFSAMTTRMGFYRRAPSITTREGKRLHTLVIWPPERARRSSYSESFNPMWYLTGHMTKCTDDFIGRLVFLYRRIKNDGRPNIIATRDGDVVVLETGNETVLNRHYFSLTQGGNVVKYFARDQNGTERRTWTYEQKVGVWIPRTFVFNHKTHSPDMLGNTNRTWKVTFVDNIVNEPIPVSQFSLKALGYSSDEQLTDQRKIHAPIYNKAQTWEQRLARELEAFPPSAPYEELPLEFAEPLLGKPLPELSRMNITPELAQDKALLVCFFDMNQRPSRHCIRELAKRAPELKEKGITVITVQASKTNKDKLNEWVKKYNIPFPTGIIQADEVKTRFAWGVPSLPWMILTDRQHIVRAEGFGLEELDEKIKQAGDR